MAPVVAGAAIAAGTSLLQGLMQQAANRKERERMAQMEGQKMAYQSQSDAMRNQQQGVGNALAQLMQQYGGII